MTTRPDWTVLPLDRTLGPHAAVWDTLLARMPMRHPMLDSRFIDTLLRHFGDGSEHLCLLGAPDAPDALCVLRRRSFGVWHSFLPSQAQVGAQLVSDSAQLKTLFKALPGWVDRIELLCIDAKATPIAHSGEPSPQMVPQALTIHIDLQGGYDTYWAARPKKLRDNLRRYERRVKEDGLAPTLRVTDDPAQLPAAIRRYAELESAGWKGAQGTALAPDNDQEAFYRELMQGYTDVGRASVHELWLNDILVGSRLIIDNGSAVVALKTTFREDHQRYAAGRILMRMTIEHLFKHSDARWLEFCTNATVDQLSWVSGHRHIEHWTVLRGPQSAAMYQTARTLRSLLRAPPAVDDKATFDVHERLADLPPDAAELVDEHARDDMQFGRPWLDNLERTVYSDHPGLRYFVLRQGGQPVAVLPLLVERSRLGQDALALGNFYTALYSPALKPWLRPEALATLVDAVVRTLAPLRSIRLAPMDPDSTGFKLLKQAFEQRGLAVFTFFCFGNWSLHGPGRWADYLAGRDGLLRSTIRRMTQRLQLDGGRIEVLTGGPELERGLAAYTRVYASSWKVPEPYPDFLPGLAALCAERGWLRLGLVWLGELPIAAQLWIVTDRRACIFKLAHDKAYRSHSPGTVLSAAMMAHALDQDGVETVDYLTGDDAYKKRWMSCRRERWGLVAYNLRSPGGLAACVVEVLGRTVKPWRSRRPDKPGPAPPRADD